MRYMGVEELDMHVLSLEDEEGNEIAEVLSSESTRSVFNLLEDQPRTPKDLAEKLEMSSQNIHYHINKLSEVGLVESIDIEYSDRGKEMKVYAPTHEGVILCDQAESKAKLEEIIARFAKGSFVAIIVSAIVHLVYERYIRNPWNSQSLMFASDSQSGLIPWWNYPSLWVFTGMMSLTVAYCAWHYYDSTPRIDSI